MDAVLDHSEGTCAVCLVEFTADGCVIGPRIDITVEAFSDVFYLGHWTVSPNPPNRTSI